ncbi:MAG TPA: hypothetical protein VIB07_02135 [Nitrososphaera sp.]
MLAIAGAVATPLLLAWLVVVMINTPAEGIMNKEQAIEIVSDYLGDQGIDLTEPEPTFALIKYNGTDINGDPAFHWLSADPHNRRTISYNGQARFSAPEGNYLASELKDRYVWVVFEGESCYATYFVDAATGELVGQGGYQGFCQYCWHMYHPETYDTFILSWAG